MIQRAMDKLEFLFVKDFSRPIWALAALGSVLSVLGASFLLRALSVPGSISIPMLHTAVKALDAGIILFALAAIVALPGLVRRHGPASWRSK